MNIEQLQLINRNETVEILLSLFATSKKMSNETNLESFIFHLKRTGNNIDKNDYLNFFNQLENANVGRIKDGKFFWNYSLQDVCDQILHPNKLVDIKLTNQPLQEREEPVEQPIKRRGRPKGSRNLSNVPLRPIAKPRQLQAEIMFMFNSSSGEVIPFKLSDAEALLNQVEQIKSKLA